MLLEAGGLVFGVVQLREAVGDFTTDDEQLEALGDFRIAVGGAGQGANFDRVVDDEGRLPALGFGAGFEQLQLQAAEAARLDLLAEGDDLGLEEFGVGQLRVGERRLLALDRLGDGQTVEGLGQVKLAALVLEHFLAQRFARGVADQAFGEVHQRVVVRVRLVELHHREFGVVARREAFVAEVAVNFKHFLEAADDQALQVQLRCDAQELLHIERVVMGDEGLGRCTAGDRVHHRRFDFHEAVAAHVVADRLDDGRTGAESEARFLVHDQVDIALTVLHFLVGQAVELVRQRAQRLRQQADFAGLDGQFAGLGLHQRADDTEDVAQVPALERGVDVLADLVAGDIDLDAAGDVLQRGERGLAHDPLQHHAAGDLDLDRQAFELFRRFLAVAVVQLLRGVFALEVVREGDPTLAQFGQLGTALGDDVVLVLLLFGVGHRGILG